MRTVCSVFGAPQAQQIPARPLSPNRFPRPRALSPVLAFTDQEEDVTHQIYHDSIDDSDNSYGIHKTSNT